MHDLPTSISIQKKSEAFVYFSRYYFPLLTDNLIFYSAGFLDGILVGRLGTQALAASAYISNIKLFLSNPSASLFSGLQPLLSNAGSVLKIRRWIHASFFITAGLSLLLIPSYLLSPFVVNAKEPSMRDLVKKYMNIHCLSVVPALWMSIFNNLLVSTGKTPYMLPFCVIRTIIEIGLSASLIYGTDLGIQGLALGTGLQPWISCGLLGLLTFLSKPVRHYARQTGINSFPQITENTRSDIKDLFKTGLPISASAFISSGLPFITLLLMGKLGAIAVSAYQIASSVFLWQMIALDPFTVMTAVTLPKLTGENSEQSKRNFFRLTNASIIFIGGLLTFFSNLFRDEITQLYVSKNSPDYLSILTLARPLILITSLTGLLYGVKALLSGIFRSEKNTKMPLIADTAGSITSVLMGLMGAFKFQNPLWIASGPLMGMTVNAATLGSVLVHRSFRAAPNSPAVHTNEDDQERVQLRIEEKPSPHNPSFVWRSKEGSETPNAQTLDV